jgi:hypothetical protein
MRWRVVSGISELPLSERETVDSETPAMRAISAICTRRLPALRASGTGLSATVTGKGSASGICLGILGDMVRLFHPAFQIGSAGARQKKA